LLTIRCRLLTSVLVCRLFKPEARFCSTTRHNWPCECLASISTLTMVQTWVLREVYVLLVSAALKISTLTTHRQSHCHRSFLWTLAVFNFCGIGLSTGVQSTNGTRKFTASPRCLRKPCILRGSKLHPSLSFPAPLPKVVLASRAVGLGNIHLVSRCRA
jgi:hypothetical protein